MFIRARDRLLCRRPRREITRRSQLRAARWLLRWSDWTAHRSEEWVMELEEL